MSQILGVHAVIVNSPDSVLSFVSQKILTTASKHTAPSRDDHPATPKLPVPPVVTC